MTIDNFKKFKNIIESTLMVGAYYLIGRDNNFVKLNKRKNLNRVIYTISKEICRNKNALNIISFDTKELEIKSLLELKNILEERLNIILMVFNHRQKKCNLIFSSRLKEKIIEKYIKEFMEVEEY